MRKTNQEWLDIIQQCRTSGLSDRQWCIENDVNFSTFYYHIRRLRSKACEIPESIKINSSSQQEIVPVSITQVRVTVDEAMRNLYGKIEIRDREGYLTDEDLYNYKPKSYLVIGNLNQLEGEHGVNMDKLRSFELFRKNHNDVEIIIFDELYERAKYIVYNNQNFDIH